MALPPLHLRLATRVQEQWALHLRPQNRIIAPTVEDGVEVHLWRYKKHDDPDFPEFPAGHLPGYDGALEERDEQSVLAASASNAAIVCGLLSDLVRGE